MITYRNCKIRWWTAGHPFWWISIWKHIEIAKSGGWTVGMSFRPKSITKPSKFAKISEIDCPTRISSKNLRKTDEIARSKTGTAANRFRRKPLGKQTKSAETCGIKSWNPPSYFVWKLLVKRRNCRNQSSNNATKFHLKPLANQRNQQNRVIDVAKRFRLKTVTEIDEIAETGSFYPLLSHQVRLGPKFVYEIRDFVYENFVSGEFRIRNGRAKCTKINAKPDFVSNPYKTYRNSSHGTKWAESDFVSKSLQNISKFVSRRENDQETNFVLPRFRHTIFSFVIRNLRLGAIRIRNPSISYTKSGFRIRNFRLVVRIWRRISSPEAKFAPRRISYTNFISKSHFVYGIYPFSYTNFVYTKIPSTTFRRGGGYVLSSACSSGICNDLGQKFLITIRVRVSYTSGSK